MGYPNRSDRRYTWYVGGDRVVSRLLSIHSRLYGKGLQARLNHKTLQPTMDTPSFFRNPNRAIRIAGRASWVHSRKIHVSDIQPKVSMVQMERHYRQSQANVTD